MVVKRRYYRITSKEDCERMRLGLQGMEEALDAEKVDLAKFNDSLSMVELSKLADVAADVKVFFFLVFFLYKKRKGY